MYTVVRHKEGGKVFLENDVECLDDFEEEAECKNLQEAQKFIEEFNVPVIWVFFDVITPHYFLHAGYRGDMRKIKVFGAIELKKELVFEALEDAQKERERGVKKLKKSGASDS